MAKKPSNPTIDLLVYIVLRLGVCFLHILPLTVALRMADLMAWFAYTVDKRHREVARENLRIAFPERCADPVECDRLVRACYLHFCTMLVEIMVLPRRLHLHNWRKYVDDHGIKMLIPHLMVDRGLMTVTCHFGNWEVASYITGLTGFKMSGIARTLDNPHLDRFLKRFRQKTGQTILDKNGDFDRINAVLENKGILGTLGDQDAGERGLFVDFFNRPASTHKAVALLALQHDVPMVLVSVSRIGHPMRFAYTITDVIDPRDYPVTGRGDAVRLMTERFTKGFEKMILEHPEQYFWLHRRWKHQPKPRREKKAAA
ncbi:lysophospholipid acyltransferase family protein [Zavarzinella formosa]|uniref:lysophospholipid acyltransferase family protein n=1 Tax=Zavarzinella formosa TaxID=360055 RepID=UPI00031544DB|nr:lysophospholipid acyltransferase family protein [Zavarzinella formosa]